MPNYKELLMVSDTFFEGIDNEITILSNSSALLNQYLENINWVGFYLNDGEKLILGPFQGKIACMTIPYDKGVCGASFTKDESLVVGNVLEFKGHIACDSNSRSEIVIPIHKDNKIYGVLDIDSPNFNNFNDVDKDNLIKFVKTLEKALNK